MEEIGFDSEKINRYFYDKYSEEDAAYVEKIFYANDKEKELKTFLFRQFDEFLPGDTKDNKNLDHILYKIHYDINTRLSEHKTWSIDNVIKWTLRIAGILILPVIIFIGINTYKETMLKKEAWVEINAPAWSRVQFSLPDGTTGWLNTKSSVKYNDNFLTNRQVTLNGEAYFDVFKDDKRPFVVKTNEVSVKVLGTKFNIASYENENNIDVVLEEGKLIFSDKIKDKSYTMSPNDLVTYDKTHKDFSIDVVEPQKYLSWKEGKLVFRNDPLDVIARRLERWYGVEVEINISSTENLRLRATFIDESLEEVLTLLKRSLPIDYKIENRILTSDEIYAKKKVIISAKSN